MQSIFWHDYETFGADTRRDRPSQFAGVRTDLDLNIIEEPTTFYCRPSEDALPSPEACLITGITPQYAQENGFSEVEFAKKVEEIFSVPSTCVAGYNSIRFDDEITRNLFYRNFIDPYEREWKNGNSRWDLIDVVRLTYALRPEGINWPCDDSGTPSFRLEVLSQANGIEHLSAHDAMSDVYATIGLAKLIKSAQPQLFDYVFKNRDKHKVLELLEPNKLKPVFHVSSKFPASKGCCALIVPLFQDSKNKNSFICFDLRQDPAYLFALSNEEIQRRLYMPSAQLSEGEERPAIKAIHVNKCPMVVPAAMIKTMSAERLERWELNLDLMRSHLEWIRNNPIFVEKIKEVFSLSSPERNETDPDLMIYSGGFFSTHDKAEMSRVRQASDIELEEEEFRFQDSRLPELLFRYKARNFPQTLTEEEQSKWERYCANKLMSADGGYLTFKEFFDRIHAISQSDIDSKSQSVLEDLRFYGESIIPYA
ncbi:MULTISPECIES: exodeoxyribonuclease I [unclassified Oleiphilus]|jgi:exodeoxyribonuclease-1|uniref:exodeoxyribonuclease I n=1 Tax=unclassified Oleiphilus TaxID=2631174 RepID=UPI0007C39C85|nr:MULTISPECIES: exodeoxyribonuclease I [unclassified Oleiphilus]KZY43958.1 exodeoxyribonuclease I [Oleiphilus sp. HI0050]KZY75239.1 exodeoxyribonuclease I [Oleiphilus sp. HI0068]KZY76678.1 exodeoxyribonuclease I [Oleiphilus sp. HI0069]KZY88483.1 exodeoxyribonuclease I [Oleiphilus sp. HI0072]KZY31786.1 exodeoxyribonuclease I [Oleiphilus sp. HI0043]